jgi:predicted nuclease of predicted toxin-antitoxin system
VRFLLDENLAPWICDRLNTVGHEAAHVRDEGMSGASDLDVLANVGEACVIVLRQAAPVRCRVLPSGPQPSAAAGSVECAAVVLRIPVITTGPH